MPHGFTEVPQIVPHSRSTVGHYLIKNTFYNLIVTIPRIVATYITCMVAMHLTILSIVFVFGNL